MVHAQPDMNLRHTDPSQFPAINLYFEATCNGAPILTSDRKLFQLRENGGLIEDFSVNCLPTTGGAVSVAMALDASGSMAGAGNAGAKAGGHAFIDLMDGNMDEAAILWFNSMVTVYQSMTTSKDLLHTSVSALPANGATAVWDGAYFSILELINNGVNQNRAVIVLTDGVDNSSGRTPADVQNLAQRNRIRLYIIGLGSAVDTARLRVLADGSMGRFYNPQAANQITQAFVEIDSLIRLGSSAQCLLSYHSWCKDGSQRSVELTLNTCSGSVTRASAYQAPLDTTDRTQIDVMAANPGVQQANRIFSMPVTFAANVNPLLLAPAHCTITYDTTLLVYQGLTGAGALLDGYSLSASGAPGRIEVTIDSGYISRGLGGTLFSVQFAGLDRKDTMCAPVRIESWQSAASCITAAVWPGTVCIGPGILKPMLHCATSAPTVFADEPNARYIPMPFNLSVEAGNTGGLPSDTVFARILLPPGLQFSGADAPDRFVKMLAPPTLSFGTMGNTRWELRHPLSTTRMTYDVRVLIYSRNADTSVCSQRIVIPVLRQPFLRAEACRRPDTIEFDPVAKAYITNPFNAGIVIRNDSGMSAVNATTEIVLPADMALMTGETSVKSVTPDPLGAGTSASELLWRIRFNGRPLNDTAYTLSWYVRYSDPLGTKDSILLTCRLPVRGSINQLACSLIHPDFIMWHPDSGMVPPVFQMNCRIRNDASWPVRLSQARLRFSPGSFTVDASTPAIRPLDVLVPGHGTYLVFWLLHSNALKETQQVRLDVEVLVEPGDTLACDGAITVWNPARLLTCALLPSVAVIDYDPVAKTYRPDTIEVMQYLRNLMLLDASNFTSTIIITDPHGLIEFNPTYPDNTNPKIRQTLGAGASASNAWGFRMKKENTTGNYASVCFETRSTATIAGRAIDTLAHCSACVMIAPAITVDARKPGVVEDFLLEQNYPNPFSKLTFITYSIPSTGNVRLIVTDMLGREVAALIDSRQSGGRHTVPFYTGTLSPSLYSIKLEWGGRSIQRSMLLNR